MSICDRLQVRERLCENDVPIMLDRRRWSQRSQSMDTYCHDRLNKSSVMRSYYFNITMR
jgi:hypothetical protein